MQNYELRQKLRESDFNGGAEVKILLKSGDIVEIEDVMFSTLSGDEIHIFAGTAEEDDVDTESELLPPHLRSV